ncbi:MAG: pitrilysin family protein [Desulfobacteraceae bacterium]|nr:pitrilysin family protein [Desulfobacteraceae bacterium]
MYRKSVLPNGVRVVSERIPHTRTVSVGIWVEVGARDEHDLNNGTAHFVEHMFFKGTPGRSARQIAIELDALGGLANAFTTQESTCYYASVLDRNLPQLIGLYADLLLNSRYAQIEVERERQVILQEFCMVEDTPDDQIQDLFAAQLWGRHPLGNTVLGSREVVQAMDSHKLGDYVRRLYVPGRILVAAAGSVEHDSFCRLWEEALAGLAPGGAELARVAPVPQPPVRKVHSRDLEQVHLVLGTYALPCHAPERYQLILLNTILGGNMSSRLFQEIRENRGLAYSVGSDLAFYEDSGSLAVSLGTDREAVNQVIGVIHEELRRITREPVMAEELANAKEYTTSSLYLAADNMEARMTRLARNEICFGREIPLAEAAAGLEQVTAAEIARLAEKLFAARDLALTALGPLGHDDIDWSLFR